MSCPRLQVDGAEGNLDRAEPVPLYTGVNSVPSLPLILMEFRQTGQHSNDSGNDPEAHSNVSHLHHIIEELIEDVDEDLISDRLQTGGAIVSVWCTEIKEKP